MTDLASWVELALLIAGGVGIAFAESLVTWWRCRDPVARVNDELARARARRRP